MIANCGLRETTAGRQVGRRRRASPDPHPRACMYVNRPEAEQSRGCIRSQECRQCKRRTTLMDRIATNSCEGERTCPLVPWRLAMLERTCVCWVNGCRCGRPWRGGSGDDGSGRPLSSTREQRARRPRQECMEERTGKETLKRGPSHDFTSSTLTFVEFGRRARASPPLCMHALGQLPGGWYYCHMLPKHA